MKFPSFFQVDRPSQAVRDEMERAHAQKNRQSRPQHQVPVCQRVFQRLPEKLAPARGRDLHAESEKAEGIFREDESRDVKRESRENRSRHIGQILYCQLRPLRPELK